MSNRHYGALYQNDIKSALDRHCEKVKYKGFTIVENAISSELAQIMRQNALRINEEQKNRFSENYLNEIGENNQIRMPFLHDKSFMEILTNTTLTSILDQLFAPTKSFYVLNQQNVIINTGDAEHNQSAWHRDFPYLLGVNSIPQAYSVLIALDDFSEVNGGTRIVTGSHLHQSTPSWEYINEEFETIYCKAGSAIVFNSQLFHASGINSTNRNRVAINTVFTNPLYRQQIDIPRAISNSAYSVDVPAQLERLLGFHSNTVGSDMEFKKDREDKINARNI